MKEQTSKTETKIIVKHLLQYAEAFIQCLKTSGYSSVKLIDSFLIFDNKDIAMIVHPLSNGEQRIYHGKKKSEHNINH